MQRVRVKRCTEREADCAMTLTTDEDRTTPLTWPLPVITTGQITGRWNDLVDLNLSDKIMMIIVYTMSCRSKKVNVIKNSSNKI